MLEIIGAVIVVLLIVNIILQRGNSGGDSKSIIRAIEGIPSSVLKVVQGSINPRKGKIGELLTLLELKGEYEIIIPLGQPIDFIGISKESIDFIEVKTGGSRLTDHEKQIQDLVREGKVGFRCVRYDIEAEDDTLFIASKN